MKITILLTLIFLPALLFSQYSSPESVTYDSSGSRYLVSNTSSSKIVARDLQGVTSDFVTVGGSIHGITVYNGRAYVCNGSRVKGYNLLTAAEEFNVTLSGSTFLNDIAIDNSGIAYITDFSNRRIYKLNTNNSEYWIYVPSTTNTPNGIYIDTPRNRLLICCWGGNAPVKSVDLADSVISNIITTPYTNCDGISLDRYENVYISTWGIQSVVKYDINFANAPEVVTGGLSNPADIFVNKNSDTLAVPNAGNNTVTFYFLDNPTSVNQTGTVIPNSFKLKQNYPNPFNPSTKIQFEIPSDVRVQKSNVKLIVYNTTGKEIADLVNEVLSPGSYEINWNAEGFASGIYFYELSVNGGAKDFRETKRMLLVK